MFKIFKSRILPLGVGVGLLICGTVHFKVHPTLRGDTGPCSVVCGLHPHYLRPLISFTLESQANNCVASAPSCRII